MISALVSDRSNMEASNVKSAHLDDDEQQKRHNHELQKREAHQHLSVRPAEILLAVVVERKADPADGRILSDIEAV